MKKILVLMATYCVFNQAFGQEIVFDLLAKTTRLDSELEASKIDSLRRVMLLDVYDYFRLDGKYSELKRTIFERTEEYKQKLAELKRVKSKVESKLLTTNYYIRQSCYGLYDVKRKGIKVEVKVDNNGAVPLESSGYYYPDNHVTFWALPKAIEIEERSYFSPRRYYMFFPMSEGLGLEVEESPLLVCYLFTLTNYFRMLSALKVRVILANGISGKIYSDRVYPSPAPTAKNSNVKK